MRPPAPIEPDGIFDGLRPGAIALGAFVDIGATLVASTLLLAWLAPEVFSEDEATSREAVARVYASTLFAVLQVALGALCTMFGAFVGARRAGRLHVRHGGWVAVASTALFALLVAFEPERVGDEPSAPFWAELLGWVLILPAGILGGALAGTLGASDRR